MQETAIRFSGSWVSWAHGEPGSDEFREGLAATCGPARADRGTTDGSDRGVGAGTGPPPRPIPRGRPRRLVRVGGLLLAAPPAAPGALAGRADRARRVRPLVGARRAGGPADPGQAPPLRPMRPLADGRRSPSPAPSGGGDSSGAGPGHRVSVARPALPPLRGPDRSRLAGRRVAAHLRAQRAGLGRPAGRHLSDEPAQHRAAVGRRLRGSIVGGHRQPPGTSGVGGLGAAGGGGARLRSSAGHGQSRRDRLAGAPRQGLVVDRGDRGRLGVRHSQEPGTGRSRGDARGGQPCHRRLGSLFGLRPSAASPPAGLLGPPAAHLRGVRGPGRRGRLGRPTAAGRPPAVVCPVVPGPRRHPATIQLPGPSPRLAAAGSVVLVVWATIRRRVDGDHLRQPPRLGAGAVPSPAATK